MTEAGIRKAADALTERLTKSGWVIGQELDRFTRPGVYISGGSDRLCVMVRLDDGEPNVDVAESIAHEVGQWPGVHDLEIRVREATGTAFLWLTYHPVV